MFPVFVSFSVFIFKTASDTLYKKATQKIRDDKVMVFLQRFVEASVALLLLLVLYFVLNISLIEYLSKFNLDFILLTLVAVLLGSTAFYFNIKAIRLGELSVVSPISQLTPAVLLLTSPIMVGDKLTVNGVVGVLLVVFGSYVLGIKNFKNIFCVLEPIKHLKSDKGVKYALLASVIYGFTSNLDKMGAQATDPFTWTFVVGLGTVVFYYFAFLRNNLYFKSMKVKECLPGILPGFTGATSSILQVYACTIWQVPYVIAIKRLSSVFSVLIGVFYFNESRPISKILGSLIVVSGTILIVLLG